MQHYSAAAYADLHSGVEIMRADLKTPAGQSALHELLGSSDVLLTSFRPSALVKLGLTWPALQRRYPALSMVMIVGSAGQAAQTPGHDLTYMAANDLVTGLDLPATLYADMGGSLMASEAVLQTVMHQRSSGVGALAEVALADAASYLALARVWGLTQPGAAVGGGHAGYGVYACKDGRVAVAALEPHFAAALCAAAGIVSSSADVMATPRGHAQIAAFFLERTRSEINALAAERDLPLHTLPA